MRKATILFTMTLSLTYSFGQDLKTSNWFTVQLPVTVDSHWQWLNEYSYRSINESVSLYQLFLRSGVRYSLNKKCQFVLSYDFIRTRTSADKKNHDYNNESRLWQEMTYRSFISNKFSMQQRLRLEERFFSNHSASDPGMAFRVRYRLAATKEFNPRWSLQLSNEWISQYMAAKWDFNQDRIFLNSYFQYNPTLQFQMGYYFIIRPAGQVQHVFALAFQKRLFFHGGRKNA